MKREKRVLVLVRVSSRIVGVLIRGVMGIEYVGIFDSCSELINFLSSKRGVAGEVNALLDIGSDCGDYSRQLGVEVLGLTSLPKSVGERVREAIYVAIRVGVDTGLGDERGFKS